MELDGIALRAARTGGRVALGAVARQGRVSVGHLSRIERGERPVTPAIVAMYRRVLGESLMDPEHRGEAGEMTRRVFNATIAAIAVGGLLTEPVARLLDRAGRGRGDHAGAVGVGEVVQVEQAEDMFTAWYFRFGGGQAGVLAQAHLRWAVGLLDGTMTDALRRRLHRAVGMLACRAAWAMVDTGHHDAARSLLTLAVHSATEADDVDLRVGVLGEVAIQHFYAGQYGDALAITRLAAGDERAGAAVRFALHAVNARAYGALGKSVECWQQVELAEDLAAKVTPEETPQWMRRYFDPAHVQHVTGQAAYALARASRSPQADAQAYTRLTSAAAQLDPETRARSLALCTTRLAALHLARGDVEEGRRVARTALTAARGLRSAQIAADLKMMRAAAVSRQQRDLAAEIDAVQSPPAKSATTASVSTADG